VDRGKSGHPGRGRGIAPSGAVSREAPLGRTHLSSEASDPSGAKQMMATYGRVVRRSAALTGAFFGISVLIVGRAAKISPQVMMAAAIISYVVKFIGFAIVVILLGKSTAFNGRMLGFTAIICILAWGVAEVVTTIKLKLPYVDPDGSGKA
jgi:hypothetical protein